MSLKVIVQYLKDFWAGIKRVFNSRIVPFVVIVVLLFSVLLYRLFDLQIKKADLYKVTYAMKTQREVTTIAPRGNIYDCNGVLLAYSELAYSVVIEDCGYYDSTKIKNKTLNKIIYDTLSIIRKHNDKVNFDFPISCSEYGTFSFTIEGNELQRFLRDIYGHKSVSELTEAEKKSTARDVVDYLCKIYQVDTNEYHRSDRLDIVYVRYNLAANSYKRYISFTLAQNISKETMAEILEASPELTGVGIEEEYLRKYNHSTTMAHIIGYTGKINESELEELKQIDPSYTANDIVGKSGIEAAYETTLAGKKGSTTMLVDTVGRVQEITSQVAATVGNDIYLTIDVKLQEQIYSLLERRIAETLITNLRPDDLQYSPVTGAMVLPVINVYFALINNGLIDIDKIAESDTVAARTVYSLFSSKKAQVVELIRSELNSSTPFNSLTSDMQEYIRRVRTILLDSDIMNRDRISSSDELSKKWSSGGISFREYLSGAINNEWVNINNLDVSTEYPTIDEVTDSINEVILEAIESDLEFNRLIYKGLIYSKIISPKYLCMLLMEQNAIDFTESEYVAIANGASTYDFIYSKIASVTIKPSDLALDPCSGSCVLENPNSGDILALVSYPSYDNNRFSGSIDSEYYKELLNDKSTPLVCRATQTKIAPGSTFKPLTAVAALTEGVVGPRETVNCTGIFESLTPNIKCWVHPGQHGPVDTEAALQGSCNVFFCEMGYRLSITPSGTLNLAYGLSRLKKYADLVGLSTKSGIQISETTPKMSDTNPAASSMGQGTNAYTSLNLARYVSTISNKGTCYNSNLVSRIVDGEGKVIMQSEPVIASTLDEVTDVTWNTVHNGMRRVILNGPFNDITKDLPNDVYGKSGTAQENKNKADHACYIMFTKDKDGNADIATTVVLPYGYTASNAGIMTYYALCAYYGVDAPKSVIFDETATLVITR